jgi:N-acetylglutamate synthase-like GNAT family acetyltransferase
MDWIKEGTTRWDDEKKRVVGDAPSGIFDRRYSELSKDDIVPGEWWRVEDDGKIVGYGWLDIVWGDAEILLATAPEARGRGVGSFILREIENVARQHGVNYLYNVVRPTHPDAARVTAWLEKRGFTASEDGTLRCSVAS